MLKSTAKKVIPITPVSDPLPLGWTEHKAPTGHTYFYNAETKQSTYTRPTIQQQAPPSQDFIPSYSSGQFAGGFSNNQFQGSNQSQGLQDHQNRFRGGRGGARGGHGQQDRRRQEPEDKPKHRYELPGCEPWVLVKTKLGRRFVHNKDTKESFWKFPENVMKAVVEYDRREREKKERRDRGEASENENEAAIAAEELVVAERSQPPAIVPAQGTEERGSSDEYEEIEVTDSEEENGDRPGPSKRQRTEEAEGQPVEFDEDDMAYQLQAMGEDYGLDPGEYGMEGDWEEGAEGLPLTEEDSNALFRDLLADFGVDPYKPWENIIEDGFIINDDRYVALPNMKSRRDCFDDWSRAKIQQLREWREKEVKKDPKIPYFQLLEQYATPKLYWPEFKKKYKKEPAMRDAKVEDKVREKLYREHVKRLVMPEVTLKSDLATLLKAQPLSALNRSTQITALPPAMLTDLRYISLPSRKRDELVHAFISTLPPAPDDALSAEDEEAEAVRRRDRERREKALAEREQRVRDEKRRQDKDLAHGRGRLREEELHLQRAMNVGKEGLKGQLEQLGGPAGNGDKREVD